LEPLTALAACLVGAVAGDCVSYAIGYHFGRALLRDRHWFSRLLTIEREQWVEKRFQEHGLKAFLFARFAVGVRSPMYMTAGILRIPFRRFLLVDTISAAIVVSLFFGLSYIFAAGFKALWEKFHRVEVVVSWGLIPVLVGAAIYAYVRWHRKQKKTTESARPAGDATREAVADADLIEQHSPHATAPEEAKSTVPREAQVGSPAVVNQENHGSFG
jgi:membrane protein DedA with SNARE-associated domain